MIKLIVLLVALLLTIGCTKKAEELSSAESTEPGSASTPLRPTKTPEAPSDVVVEVDGVKLTRAQQEMELKNILANLGNKVQPQQLEEATRLLRKRIVNQFIISTLLLNEAERQNISSSKEEEEEELENIKAKLPPGVTFEEVIKNGALSAEQIHEQIQTVIKINKLIAEHTPDVTEEEISNFFEKNKDNLVLPENVHARHILIAVDPSDNDKEKTGKKEKAEKIRQQLINGSDFSELAKQYSDCPSRQKGGDLGKFKRGQMVKAFEDAAFPQETNTISSIVETKFGYHIIQVLEHNDGGLLSQEEVATILKNQKKDEAVNDLINKLRQKAEIKDYRTPSQPPPQ